MKPVRSLIAAAAFALAGLAGAAQAAEQHVVPPSHEWQFEGVFGTFDRASLQRGFRVYKDVCSACHSLQYVSFRSLEDLGFSEAEAEAVAAEYQVPGAPDEFGDPTTRTARLSDRLPSPYPNEQAARAANAGALPPDLSLITKNREFGPDYVRAVLVGYTDPPEDVEVAPGMNYNAYFPGHQIAMPPPLSEGLVEFPDGTEATVDQMAADVTVFLHWAANPNLETRHRLGFQVMIFLVAITVLFWFVKRQVWSKLDH